MPNYALVRDDVIENIIVADDHNWVLEHVTDEGYDRAVDVATLSGSVSPGYVYKHGSGYLPPVALDVSKSPIASDGTDKSTVTYTDNRPNPPASVDGDVNGAAVTVALTGGVGSLDVTSKTAGDTVTVTLGGAVATIGVT